MNKYRKWQLIIAIVMIAITTVVSKFSSYWEIIWAVIVLLLGWGFYMFQKRGEKLEALAILKNWLEDERISNVLKQSQLSDFVIISHSIFVSPKSKYLMLLQEYLGNVKIKNGSMRVALELYYGEYIWHCF